jgi:serine/threonine protein kinase, bacterial
MKFSGRLAKFILIAVLLNANNARAYQEKPAFTVYPLSGKSGDTITIVGSNFKSNPSENIVAFNKHKAKILSASQVQLKVSVPARAGDGLVEIVNDSVGFIGPFFNYIESIPVVKTISLNDTIVISGMAVWNGALYCSDFTNSRIIKITDESTISVLAGSVNGFKNGKLYEAQFDGPFGIAIDESGTIYIADSNNGRVRKITHDGNVSTVWARRKGNHVDFARPSGVVVDKRRNIYVVDFGVAFTGHKIYKINSDEQLTTFAGSTMGHANGQGVKAKFQFPFGLAMDNRNTLYVCDKSNDRIRKISTTGAVTDLAGGASGFADGQGSHARFSNPTGIVTDSAGNVYVTDSGNDRIRMISPSGMVRTIAGSVTGYEDGEGPNAKFHSPSTITIDKKTGCLYVYDSGNFRLRKIIFE